MGGWERRQIRELDPLEGAKELDISDRGSAVGGYGRYTRAKHHQQGRSDRRTIDGSPEFPVCDQPPARI